MVSLLAFSVTPYETRDMPPRSVRVKDRAVPSARPRGAVRHKLQDVEWNSQYCRQLRHEIRRWRATAVVLDIVDVSEPDRNPILFLHLRGQRLLRQSALLTKLGNHLAKGLHARCAAPVAAIAYLPCKFENTAFMRICQSW